MFKNSSLFMYVLSKNVFFWTLPLFEKYVFPTSIDISFICETSGISIVADSSIYAFLDDLTLKYSFGNSFVDVSSALIISVVGFIVFSSSKTFCTTSVLP